MVVLLSILSAIILVVSTYVGVVRHRFEAEIKTFNTLVLAAFAGYFLITSAHAMFLVILMALLFSASGDYFLAKRKGFDETETKSKLFFVAGLGSFLIGYLFYGIGFTVYSSLNLGSLVGLIVGGGGCIAQYFTMDKKRLAGFRLPVIAYLFQATMLAVGALTILFTGITAVTLMIALGCISLYISDSFIGHNLFRSPMDKPELYVLPTYILGQGLILISSYLMFM